MCVSVSVTKPYAFKIKAEYRILSALPGVVYYFAVITATIAEHCRPRRYNSLSFIFNFLYSVSLIAIPFGRTEWR